MGLHLYCGNENIRAGSYSLVMQQWTAVLRAYLLYLRENKLEGIANDMDRALQRVDRRRTATQVEACLQGDHAFDEAKLRKLSRRLLPGIRHLVLGQGWSPYEAREILVALGKLKPFFHRIPELELDDKGKYYLETILRVSVRDGESIRFV
jgi:hypothetical protein